MINEFDNKTLGIISSKIFWSDSDGIKTTGGFARQIEGLSQYYREVMLIVPFKETQSKQPGYCIRIEGLRVVPLPYHTGSGIRGKLDSLIKLPRITQLIWQSYKRCDVNNYWMSGYVGTIGLLVHKLRRSRPGFTRLGTDWPERIRQTHDTPVRRFLARILVLLLPWLMRGLPLFAVGELSSKYGASNPYAHADVQTVLSETEIAVEIAFKYANPLRLLYVGRLSVEKGLRYLIEAVSICAKQGIPIHLTLVGDGEERGQLEFLTVTYGIQDQVHFTGFVPLGDELRSYYRQANVFVLPSLSEGVPKVLIEAMASGLHIIATQVGGIPTLIEDGVNGRLVEPRSAVAIAEAIQDISREPEACQQMAKNTLASAKEYTIEAQTEQLIKQLQVDFQEIGWVG